MKLEFLSFDFDKFASEMLNLKNKKGLKKVWDVSTFWRTPRPTSVAA